MTIDYRDLLKKYIEHVGVSEGTDFLEQITIDNKYNSQFNPIGMSMEECELLAQLSKEVWSNAKGT